MSRVVQLHIVIIETWVVHKNWVLCGINLCASVGTVADINVSSDEIQRESVISGRLLRLACNVHGLPTPHIVWSRDGVDLPTISSLRLVL